MRSHPCKSIDNINLFWLLNCTYKNKKDANMSNNLKIDTLTFRAIEDLNTMISGWPRAYLATILWLCNRSLLQ